METKTRAFITGINGFAGSFLAELLLSKGYDVYGVVKTDNSNLESVENNIKLFTLDLLDKEGVEDVISEVNPNLIFHLAALTSPSQSFKDPTSLFTTNISAQVNIFNAVSNLKINPKILITSSAEIYGMVDPKNLPANEETPLRPTSPYAVSKITQDFLGLQYFLSNGLQVVRVRPFNHIGPRQSPDFVVASFAKQISDIEKEKCEPVIKVGNLESKRDFTDVRDMVKAYELVIRLGKSGDVYNVGSGKSYQIKDVLNKLLSMSDKDIRIEIDPERFRPGDISETVSDSSKLRSLTGWSPEIIIEETLKDTLDYFRNQKD